MVVLVDIRMAVCSPILESSELSFERVFRKFAKLNFVEGFMYRLFFLAMHRMLVAVDLVFNNLLENIVGGPGSSFSWSFGARRTFSRK